MGNKHSVTADANIDVALNSSFSAIQNCITVTSGGNNIYIQGSNNYVEGIYQTVDVDVNTTCISSNNISNSLESSIMDNLNQVVSQDEAAFSNFIDQGPSNLKAAIQNAITDDTTITDYQNCFNNLSGSNTLNVNGNQNVVANIVQNYIKNSVKDCAFGNSGLQNMASTVSVNMAQNQQFTTHSFFSPFTDMFANFGADIEKTFIAIVIGVIVLALVVGIGFMLLRGKGGGVVVPEFSSLDLPPI